MFKTLFNKGNDDKPQVLEDDPSASDSVGMGPNQLNSQTPAFKKGDESSFKDLESSAA